MSNSNLVTYTKISPNKTVMTNKKNELIIVHHMAGNLSVETCGNVFAPTSRQASSNYGINGKYVGMYCEEKDRSWCSSSRDADGRGISIEVANTTEGVKNRTWEVSDESLETLVKLCVDICQRNGIEKLVWTGDKKGNLQVHQFYAATACPGPYLLGKMPWLAEEVNRRLGNNEPTPKPVDPEKPNSYVVVKGDCLYNIGKKLGCKWTYLAEKNNIKAPYTIYPGQVLYY